MGRLVNSTSAALRISPAQALSPSPTWRSAHSIKNRASLLLPLCSSPTASVLCSSQNNTIHKTTENNNLRPLQIFNYNRHTMRSASQASSAASTAQTTMAPPGTQQQARTRPTQGQMVEAATFPSPGPIIDIGVNLVDKSFEKDREAVLRRAQAANVKAIIVTGTCVRTSQAAARLCDEFKDVYPLYFTAGVHPHNAKVHRAHPHLSCLRFITPRP